MPNGHEDSHHFLVDDFLTVVNAWGAARYRGSSRTIPR
ncbi:hypothetical protein M2283_009834 [Streptomyces pseudovenezuelae]|uniref:Uncharacterized protein n=1 Tax=Streptomyces pseudovenezuelae TaxID=67350 RepID=A0ABT6M1Q5_9ACTN|nr:hypothetical protein [Streptomyces pseudovenezuelae]